MRNKKGILKGEQITNYILSQVKSGNLIYNSVEPSIMRIVKEFEVANEAVANRYNSEP